jgi:ribosomal protein L29
MKQSEINELSVEELNDKLEKLSNEHASLKITHALSSIENPAIIKKKQKNNCKNKNRTEKKNFRTILI